MKFVHSSRITGSAENVRRVEKDVVYMDEAIDGIIEFRY